MKTITSVYFEREERAVFKKVLTSINIGWPHEERPGRERDDPVRRLGAVASRSAATVPRAVLQDAFIVCFKQYAVCELQSSEDYWRPLIVRGRPSAKQIDVASGVPLIPDPDVAVKTLAEARQLQAREAEAAVKILKAALELCPVDENELKYEDI